MKCNSFVWDFPKSHGSFGKCFEDRRPKAARSGFMAINWEKILILVFMLARFWQIAGIKAELIFSIWQGEGGKI